MGSVTHSSTPPRLRALGGWWAIAAGVAVALAAAIPVVALAPFPTPGSAVVDGDPGEWTADDLFTTMQHHGSEVVVGTLSARYDCESEVLSVLVLSADGAIFRADFPDNAYVRIDGTGKIVSGESGNDGTPPDFAWVGRDGDAARGFEASAVVAPGEHTIRVHILMFDDSSDGYLTIDSHPRTGPLTLECPSDSPSPSETPTGSVGQETGSPSVPPTESPSVPPSEPPTGSPSAPPSEGPSEPPPSAGPTPTPPPTDLLGGRTSAMVIDGLLLMIAGLTVLNVVAFAAARAWARRQ